MTIEKIILYAIPLLFAPAVNSIFRRYVDPRLPEPKRAWSYIKRLLSFIMGYVVPFAEIILFMLDKSIVVDKVFILLIGVLLSILVFNSVFSIIRIIEKKSLESTNFILKNSLDSTDKNITLHENAKEIFNHQTNVNTTVRKMIEAHEKQIRNLQDQVVRLRRRSKD